MARYNNNAYKIDIPRDKYNMSDTFNITDLSPFHGDEDLDPRMDLSQGGRGGGDDAEHPMYIPMDPSSTPQAPSGPSMRARARAIESEVTSLLSEFPCDTFGTWILPQEETLCVLRYQEEGRKQEGHQEQGEGFARAQELGVQPVHHRLTTAPPVQPVHYRQQPLQPRPSFCSGAVQDRYHPSCSA